MKVELDKWFWAVEFFDSEDREVDMSMRGDLYFGILGERVLDFRLVGCDSGTGGFFVESVERKEGFRRPDDSVSVVWPGWVWFSSTGYFLSGESMISVRAYYSATNWREKVEAIHMKMVFDDELNSLLLSRNEPTPEVFIVFEGDCERTPGFSFIDVVRDKELFEEMKSKVEGLVEFSLF